MFIQEPLCKKPGSQLSLKGRTQCVVSLRQSSFLPADLYTCQSQYVNQIRNMLLHSFQTQIISNWNLESRLTKWPSKVIQSDQELLSSIKQLQLVTKVLSYQHCFQHAEIQPEKLWNEQGGLSRVMGGGSNSLSTPIQLALETFYDKQSIHSTWNLSAKFTLVEVSKRYQEL